MTSTIIFSIIITIILFDFVLDRVLDYLNDKSRKSGVPNELEGLYDREKYNKMQAYNGEKSKFGNFSSAFSVLLILIMLFFDGFAYLDDVVRARSENPITISLLFFGVIAIGSDLLAMPFSLYSTFVIEDKFGFNKTTLKTFILDKIKGYALMILVGGGILSLLVLFYQAAGKLFWVYAWALVTTFLLLTTMFYASVILPLFNKLKPLENGELRTAIEQYSDKVGFKLNNIFVMNGSKRSTKANAFFSGLGSKKRIVLYDTLIEKHTTDELVAVLAHEVGHYKKKHTLSSVIISIVQTGFMLFLLSLMISSPMLAKALGVDQPSFHIGVIAFSLLYSPISEIMGIAMNALSRKNEFQADAFAKATSSGKALEDGLKKLSIDTLSNLNPHPAYVFFYYSHPPLLQRIKALRA